MARLPVQGVREWRLWRKHHVLGDLNGPWRPDVRCGHVQDAARRFDADFGHCVVLSAIPTVVSDVLLA